MRKEKSTGIRIMACMLAVACLLAFTPVIDGPALAASRPAKVKGLTLTKSAVQASGDCKVTAKWKKVKKNVKKYQVRIKRASAKKASFKTLAKSKLKLSFKGKSGATYTVKVRALAGKKKGKWSAAKKITIAKPLTTYWSKTSAAAKRLRAYVTKVTNSKNKKAYIPKKDRIAVFDMDGTLTCETYFTYYDTMMFIDFCLKDYPDKVSNELKEAAKAIKPGYKADLSLAKKFAQAFKGMSVQDVYNFAVKFGKRKTTSFNNMRYIDGFYLPMVELVKYLSDNGFTVYVVSGTERTTTRAIVANSPIKNYVPPRQVIGSEFEVKVKGHEDEDYNTDYKYVNGNTLIYTGDLLQKNLNANKPIYIEREIGKRPVLAFGNSGSDTSMMDYAIDTKNKYPAEAYMVIADDNVREWGTSDWKEDSAKYKAMGYMPISMKGEFKQIYPKKITKAKTQY